MRSATVFLFDIDGTLIRAGGAGRRAMEAAFLSVTGRTDALKFDFGGMTDRAIVRTGLRAIGSSDEESAIDRVIAAYLEGLEVQVQTSVNYRVLPQVKESVEALLAFENSAVGLGTGNIRAGAERKLRRGGLWEFFPFGGFGCDAEDRAELLRIGAERGAAQLNLTLAACRVIVIGDTRRDIAAAQSIGAECLAVATGDASVDELRAAGATWAATDLGDPIARAALSLLK